MVNPGKKVDTILLQGNQFVTGNTNFKQPLPAKSVHFTALIFLHTFVSFFFMLHDLILVLFIWGIMRGTALF